MNALTLLSLAPIASILIILPVMLASVINVKSNDGKMGHADNLLTVPLGRERFYNNAPNRGHLASVRNEYHSGL